MTLNTGPKNPLDIITPVLEPVPGLAETEYVTVPEPVPEPDVRLIQGVKVLAVQEQSFLEAVIEKVLPELAGAGRVAEVGVRE